MVLVPPFRGVPHCPASIANGCREMSSLVLRHLLNRKRGSLHHQWSQKLSQWSVKPSSGVPLPLSRRTPSRMRLGCSLHSFKPIRLARRLLLTDPLESPTVLLRFHVNTLWSLCGWSALFSQRDLSHHVGGVKVTRKYGASLKTSDARIWSLCALNVG